MALSAISKIILKIIRKRGVKDGTAFAKTLGFEDDVINIAVKHNQKWKETFLPLAPAKSTAKTLGESQMPGKIGKRRIARNAREKAFWTETDGRKFAGSDLWSLGERRAARIKKQVPGVRKRLEKKAKDFKSNPFMGRNQATWEGRLANMGSKKRLEMSKFYDKGAMRKALEKFRPPAVARGSRMEEARRRIGKVEPMDPKIAEMLRGVQGMRGRGQVPLPGVAETGRAQLARISRGGMRQPRDLTPDVARAYNLPKDFRPPVDAIRDTSGDIFRRQFEAKALEGMKGYSAMTRPGQFAKTKDRDNLMMILKALGLVGATGIASKVATSQMDSGDSPGYGQEEMV